MEIPNSVRIFVGSSSEGRRYAKILAELLREEAVDIFESTIVKVTGWWEDNVFPVGSHTMEGLETALRSNTAALLVASADDITYERDVNHETMRSNVLLEYGLFCGAYGRHCVALAPLGKPYMASDLSGITYLKTRTPDDWKRKEVDLGDFKETSRGEVRKWLECLERSLRRTPTVVEDVLPSVNAAIVSMIKLIQENKQNLPVNIDAIAAEMIAATASAFDQDNNGIDIHLVSEIDLLLPQADGIWAIDVLGPKGWVSPRTYEYLAPQLRHYFSRNSRASNWHLTVEEDLGQAIVRSLENAKGRSLPNGLMLKESGSNFGHQSFWTRDRSAPSMQYARILLWSDAELKTSFAESVIAIHEAFNIPLFYLPVESVDPVRAIDYIYFTHETTISGHYGLRQDQYKTRRMSNGRIPEIGDVREHFKTLLQSPHLLFAVDAYRINRGNER